MITARTSSSVRSGLTFVELLVSITISMLLLSMLSFAMISFTNSYVRSRDKVISDRDAELALDYIIRDLESMIIPSRRTGSDNEVEVLRISPDDESEANAHWLTMLAMTNDRETDVSNGVVRAVSYRIGYQDPIEGPSGFGEPEYALYRKVLTAGDTFEQALISADPRTEIWLNEAIVPEITPVEDYLSAHVVGFRVSFLSRDSRLPLEKTDQLTIRSDGIFINNGKITTAVTWAEVSLTILSNEGAAPDSGMEFPFKT